MTGTQFKVEKVKRPWRGGIPIDNEKRKTVIRITLDYMISHDEFLQLKANLHEADVENIRNISNPETPFLIKDLALTIDLLNRTAYPPRYLLQLKQLTQKLQDVVRHAIATWRSKTPKEDHRELWRCI